MLLTIVTLVLVAFVEFGSCLTCFTCQAHDPQACSPILCAKHEACILLYDRLHVVLPTGCKPRSACEPGHCCFDDGCVRGIMATANAPYITPTVQMTTTYSQTCNDEVVSMMTDCNDLASSGACTDHSGVQMCKRTCGFCDYVTTRFGDQGYCRDTLLNDQCAKQNICADASAIELCPQTCELCDLKLQNVMKDFLNRTTTTAPSTVTTASTTNTTSSASTRGTIKFEISGTKTSPLPAISTTLSKQCVDELENNGCSLLPQDICQQSLAHTMCPKFCNLCGTS